MNSNTLLISPDILRTTLESLRVAGLREVEAIVLWLGRRRPDGILIGEAYVPLHTAARGYFNIPPEGMKDLLNHLADTGMFVASQVHSHPHEAFHSQADDDWAIVRHVGAFSVVVPDFAQHTTIDSFLDDAGVFRLSVANVWVQLLTSEVAEAVSIR